MDAVSDTAVGLQDPLSALLAAYSYLATRVDPSLSSTARFLHTGDPERARTRLIEEAEEALVALEGLHRHPPEKTRLAVQLLQTSSVPADYADVLLELNQISYWSLLYSLRTGVLLDSVSLRQSLQDGAISTDSPRDLAGSLHADPSAGVAYRLIGCISADRGMPLVLFARLDLADMAGRPYLREFFSGL